jgi:hypothetical protein
LAQRHAFPRGRIPGDVYRSHVRGSLPYVVRIGAA